MASAMQTTLYFPAVRTSSNPVVLQVIKQDPKHADALHQLGVLLLDLHGQDKFDEASSLIQKSINAVPKQAK